LEKKIFKGKKNTEMVEKEASYSVFGIEVAVVVVV
jgi:hypothetical protein